MLSKREGRNTVASRRLCLPRALIVTGFAGPLRKQAVQAARNRFPWRGALGPPRDIRSDTLQGVRFHQVFAPRV